MLKDSTSVSQSLLRHNLKWDLIETSIINLQTLVAKAEIVSVVMYLICEMEKRSNQQR